MTSELDLCRAFADAHPGDAARVLDRLTSGDVTALLEALHPPTASRVFAQMAPTAAADCLERMRPEAAAALVAGLRTDVAAPLLRSLDAAVQRAVLERMPPAEAEVLRTILRYPDGTAGALMDPRAVTIADDVAAGPALATIRRSPRHTLHYVFVVDREHRLVGVAGLRQLLLAPADEPVTAIMNRSVRRLSAQMGRAAILAHPGWRQFHALPVVDEASVLVGVVGYETFRTLESDALARARRPDAVTTVFALGELYWLGLSGLIDSLASVVRRTPSRPAERAEGDHGLA